MTDEITFDDEELAAASHWYGGQGSMLYAVTSTGVLSRGTIRPRHHEGGLMTDEEWMIDLAERLEHEAEVAARDAAKQAKKAKGAEKKELLSDREGLLGIAYKARQFVRDAERAQKSKTSTTTRHATKKTPTQLRREIDEVIRKGPQDAPSSPVAVNDFVSFKSKYDGSTIKGRVVEVAWLGDHWSAMVKMAGRPGNAIVRADDLTKLSR